jgi:hypothetical protein
MIATPRHERPGRLTIQLLRAQYWFDRLSEPRRLLVGLLAIVFLGACLLYVLGFTSSILVSRMGTSPAPEPAPGPASAETAAPAVVVEAGGTPEPARPTAAPVTPTATPPVDQGGSLIQPPEVPEVAIIPAPPRIYEPQPLKPRVVATPVATARAAAPTVATPQPTRAGGNGGQLTPAPLPPRTVVPTNGPIRTPTPVRAQQGPPLSTPTAPAATPRAAVSTPVVPTAVPRTTVPAGPPATAPSKPR